MDKGQNEKRTAELVKLGSKTVPVPKHIENRILSEISAASREKEQKSSSFSIKSLRYTPALGFAAAALVLIPVIVIILNTLSFGGIQGIPITVAAESGARLKDSGNLVAFGGNIDENDTIITDGFSQTGFSRKALLDIQLFSDSEFEITGFDPESADFTAVLHSGSLYAHKKDKQSGSSVTINADNYDFIMTGTRIYLSSKNNGYIHALCFEGTLEVYDSEEHIHSISPGNGIRIFPDNSMQILPVEELSPDAADLDSKLMNGLPGSVFPEEPKFVFSSDTEQVIETDVENIITQESASSDENSPVSTAYSDQKEYSDDLKDHEIISQTAEAEEEKERYTINSIASVAESGDSFSFYSMVSNGNQTIIVNSQSVYSLEEESVIKRTSLSGSGTFKTNPVAAGTAFVLPAADEIITINADNMESDSISLPADGSIDHNFSPALLGGKLYVPVQNYGYYSLDLSRQDPDLDLVAEEKFPVSPGMIGNQLIIGAYYNNYLAGVGPGGETSFKNSIDGKSTVNFTVYESDIYQYSEENGRYYIRKFSSSGTETGKWELRSGLKSDFLVLEKIIFGIYSDGSLFYLDTSKNSISVLAVLFKGEPTSRQWRNAGISVYDNELFCPTDYGRILIADISKREIIDEITVNQNEKFYTAPVVHGNTVYAVSSKGMVYSIIRNEK